MEKKCRNCLKRYIAKTKRSLYCSKRCNHLFNQPLKGAGSRGGKYFPCVLCGKEHWFRPARQLSKLKFCCRDHQIQYQKQFGFKFNCIVCGTEVRTQLAQVQLRNRKTCSISCRGALARLRAEERRIKFGYTKHQLDRLARYSPESSNWRKCVFQRDNYTCVVCGVRGGKLEADHIKPWAFFPELRFVLSNGRTLCRKCHDKTKKSYKEMRKIYSYGTNSFLKN